MSIKAKEYYDGLLSAAIEKKKNLDRRITLIGTMRLLVFVAAIVGCYMVWGSHAAFWSIMIGGIVLFLWLVKLHAKVFLKRELADAEKNIAEDNLNRLALNLDKVSTGKKYIDTRHEYTYDLDIFGERSIFALLDTTCTSAGADTLAEALISPLKLRDTITPRQEAVKELKEATDLRTAFRAYGMVNNNAKTHDNMAALPIVPVNRILEIAIYSFPILVAVVIVLAALSIIPTFWVSTLVVIGIAIAGLSIKKTSQLHQELQSAADSISSLHSLIEIIENSDFNSQYLNKLRTQLTTDSISASTAAKKLGKVITNFDQRYNAISFLILNGLMMWDLRQVNAAARWIKQFGDKLPQWQAALAQFDALSSLATFAFNNTDYVFPKVDKSGEIMLAGTAVGHPLIASEKCVCNDVAAMSDGTFQVITGANMAGKSTYLRTVGVNYILALIGAPVYAAKMVFSPVKLLTGLRTTDSLQDNESYFFAELQRLKSIIDRAESGERMMVILDEILKGTNSVDKQKGSLALVEKLVKMKVGGIIATHDLMLGELAAKFPANISNYRFEATIADDTLTFSYRIAPGIAQNMNACFLMQKMGII